MHAALLARELVLVNPHAADLLRAQRCNTYSPINLHVFADSPKSALCEWFGGSKRKPHDAPKDNIKIVFVVAARSTGF